MARNHRAGRGNNGGLEHHRREDHRGRAPPRSGRRRLRTRRHHLLLSADDERAPRHQVQDRHRLHGRQSDQPRDGARRSRSPEQHLVELEGDQGGLAQGEENHRDCASRPARARPRCSLGRGCGSHARGAPAHRATGVRHPARPAVRHQRSAGRPRRRAPLSLRQHDERPGVPVGSAGARLRRRAGAGREDAADRGKGAFDAQRRGGESQGTAGVILPFLALILAAAQQRCYLALMTASAISNIRNFSIVAHIDHGKSTLADRLIQLTGGLEEREMVEQVLDSMDIERERGITIKAQTVRLKYKACDGKDYILNLIDTPGHVDFAYEVNRSLAACEGSLLVVDASQGVEAQTLANVYHAIDAGHEIVSVLNKVDLPAAEVGKVKQQIEDVIGLDASNAIEISAKTGLNVPEVLEAIVTRLPPPKGDRNATLKALLVDSWYDAYLGVVVLVRIVDGILKKGQRIRMMGTNAAYEVDRVGVFRPKLAAAESLGPGEIGFLTGSIKEVADTRVGDTITD